MISLLFADAFIISICAKNCSRTKWTARRSTTAPSDYRARTTNGSNSTTITIERERVLFIVYADLECILHKTKSDKEDASYAYQEHDAFSIGYYVRCTMTRYRRITSVAMKIV